MQPSTPYHLDLVSKQDAADSEKEANKSKDQKDKGYTCHICGFSASRLNVIVLHNKTHRWRERERDFEIAEINRKSKLTFFQRFCGIDFGEKDSSGQRKGAAEH